MAGVSVQMPQAAQQAPEPVRVPETVDTAAEIRAAQMELLEARYGESLTKVGYNPPNPPPLVVLRQFREVANLMLVAEPPDSKLLVTIEGLEKELSNSFGASLQFYHELEQALEMSGIYSAVTRVEMFFGRIHSAIDKASISVTPPIVNPELQARMRRYEAFSAGAWTDNNKRASLSIHIDLNAKNTIFQICTAEHGPIYLTVPGLLNPEDVAHRTIGKMIKRLEPLTDFADPLAVIDGAHSSLNYNYLFANSRVIRAPSGNLERLTENLAVTSTRSMLSPENTAFISAAPKTRDEYQCVFPRDTAASHWGTWAGEADQWRNVVQGNGFAVAAEAGREQLISALVEKQNVIVLISHCEGQELFMPDPPPTGTIVTTDYIREHRAAISANKPFVYLFACEAGRLEAIDNFASTLLDCGASGVIASQSVLGAGESRDFLNRIIGENRRAPPIEDFWAAISETDFREMEIFVA
jgi:hypothetical protein